MGLTFKENCPDLRNTRVTDIIKELESYGIQVDVYDPWVNPDDAKTEYGIEMTNTPQSLAYDAMIVAVAHDEFVHEVIANAYGKPRSVIFDVKGILPRSAGALRL